MKRYVIFVLALGFYSATASALPGFCENFLEFFGVNSGLKLHVQMVPKNDLAVSFTHLSWARVGEATRPSKDRTVVDIDPLIFVIDRDSPKLIGRISEKPVLGKKSSISLEQRPGLVNPDDLPKDYVRSYARRTGNENDPFAGMSRGHVTFFVEYGRLVVLDGFHEADSGEIRRSMNGTLINGQPMVGPLWQCKPGENFRIEFGGAIFDVFVERVG